MTGVVGPGGATISGGDWKIEVIALRSPRMASRVGEEDLYP